MICTAGFARENQTQIEQRNSQRIVYGPGDGHEVPTPFEMVNHRFELADGEDYALWGKVEWPYFRIDLKKHPWLSSSNRYEKYYMIDDPTFQMKKWNLSYIRLYFKARVKIVERSGILQHSVSVEPRGISLPTQ
jgi:hypothetical protein